MSTGVLDQIPRSTLALLLGAQVVVMLPHLSRLPAWIPVVWVCCVIWRVLIYRGRMAFPRPLTKLALLVLTAIAILPGYKELSGLGVANGMLILTFSLKLLEASQRRDALVLVYLAYFLIGVEFLYEQGMSNAAYQLFAATLVTGVLVGVYQSWDRPRLAASLKTAGILLMQAVPLTLVMFVFFPRVAPLWSVPLPGAAARSGISDSMTPGQVAKLGLSEELAFRVEFDGPAPARKDLYWRVLTFSHYENGTWSGGKLPLVGEQLVRWSSMRKEPNWLQVLERKGQAVPYAVIAEPSHQPWLFALDLAEPLSPGLGLGRDFRVLTRKPVTTRIRYEIESWSGVLLDPVLPDWLRKRETRVPASGEARTRALVQQLWSGDAQVFMDQVLDMFRNQPFFYTLTPPVLQESDQIDQFLFDTRRGFCAHYAGAFVYMMRLAGLPARVVAGYQGGVPNPMGDHILVRQYDAHAWAEVWLADRGWVRGGSDGSGGARAHRTERGCSASDCESGSAITFPCCWRART